MGLARGFTLGLLMLVLILSAVEPIVPRAYAASTPIVNNHINPLSPGCVGVRICKTQSFWKFLAVQTIGDTITVQVAVEDVEASCTAPTLSTPVSTPVYTWTPLPSSPQSATGGNICVVQGFWTTTARSTTAINFTFTESGGTLVDISFGYILLDWSNLDPTQLDTQVGKCLSSCTTSFVPLSSPLTFNPYNVIFGFWNAQNLRVDGPPTDPSGATQYGSQGASNLFTTFSYVKVVSTSGTTLYSGGLAQTTQASQLNWAVTLRGGADFSVVVACNWFQLQCWWYPFFFFSTYICFLIPVAKVGEIDRRDFGWVFLDGLTISSLIATMMGMINIMVPMVLGASAVLWVIRNR